MQTEAYEVSGTRGKNIKDRFVEAEYEDTEPWLDEASAAERPRLRDAFPKPGNPAGRIAGGVHLCFGSWPILTW
jgi:hypothetical protein